MTDSQPSTGEDAAAARAAEQARLRKERREAKIKAGGSARLNKITGLGGGFQRGRSFPPDRSFSAKQSSQELTTDQTFVPPPTQPQPHGDPEEVDISQHFYSPSTAPRRPTDPGQTAPSDPTNLSEAQLRQLMFGFDRPGAPPPGDNSFNFPGAGDDPMAKLLSQMMGAAGMPGGGAAAGSPFAAATQPAQRDAAPDRYAALWRVLHFLVAVGLGLYITFYTPFNGSRAERDEAAAAHAEKRLMDVDAFKEHFFYAFATAETALLTTRYFLDRRRATPGGVLWSVAGMLPEPLKQYLGHGLRYWQTVASVRSDILVCIFVLGACSWYRAASEA